MHSRRLALPLLLLLLHAGCGDGENPVVPAELAVQPPAHGVQFVLPPLDASNGPACYSTAMPFGLPTEVVRLEVVQDDPEAETEAMLVETPPLWDLLGYREECETGNAPLAYFHGGVSLDGDARLAPQWEGREVFLDGVTPRVDLGVRLYVRTQSARLSPVRIVVNVHVPPPEMPIDRSLGVQFSGLLLNADGNAEPDFPVHFEGEHSVGLLTGKDGRWCITGLTDGTFRISVGDQPAHEETTLGPSHLVSRSTTTDLVTVQSYQSVPLGDSYLSGCASY